MPLPPPSTPVPTSAQEGAALPSATGAAAGSRGPEARIREAPLARFPDIRSQSKGPLHREPGPEEGGRPYLTEVRDLPLHVLIWSSLGLHFGLRDTERFLQALRFPERLGGDNQSCKLWVRQLSASRLCERWQTPMAGYGTTHPQNTRTFSSFRSKCLQPHAPERSTLLTHLASGTQVQGVTENS